MPHAFEAVRCRCVQVGSSRGTRAARTERQVTLSEADRSTLIARWILKSSDSEEDRMDRAERMVRAAIDKHPPFHEEAANFRVYVKGSYANETNVRQDSDVDVVVENQRLFYWDYINGEIEAKATPDPKSLFLHWHLDSPEVAIRGGIRAQASLRSLGCGRVGRRRHHHLGGGWIASVDRCRAGVRVPPV